MTRIKICGIRQVDHARTAVEAGADFLSFVFYERSRRAIRPEEAREIVAVARETGGARMVGVFVDESPSTINAVAKAAGLDYAQLSGNEPEEIVEALDLPSIQVIHVYSDADPIAMAERIERARSELVMLDTPSEDFGGTGRAFDWRNIPPIGRPFLLAGGLNSENVGKAIRQIRPWGVDVSSGVETSGVKDPARINDFISAVRGATAPSLQRKERA